MDGNDGLDPFDLEDSSYLVLMNAEGQYSLWPAGLEIPQGWKIAYSESTKQQCLNFVSEAWTDMRPGELKEFVRGKSTPGQTHGPANGNIAHATVAELFKRQVSKTPFAEALVSAAGRLSYNELDCKVERVCDLLLEHQIEPEATVAVLLDHSDNLVVTLLATQRCGVVYVPLDVNYPSATIRHILDISKPSLIISISRYEHLYENVFDKKQIIVLDRTRLPPAAEKGDSPNPRRSTAARRPHPLDAACVMYTSESTGPPNAVVLPQIAIANHLLWLQRKYSLSVNDRVLQKTPAVCDVSLRELLWPLIVGATLVIAPSRTQNSPAELAAIVRREDITAIHFVPSMLDLFLEEIEIEDCDSLRHVFASDEVLTVKTAQRFSEVTSAALHNLYGPTEATIDAIAWDCRISDPSTSQVPIGFPADHTRAYVLDESLQQVATGSAGELYITGIQIARCYLGNAALTAERFIACPFEADGDRMYRTGDRVKINKDRSLEFIGSTPAPPEEDSQLDVEEIICGLVSNILGGASIVPDDNFFDAGADSLAAIRLVSRISRRFNVDFNLRALIVNPQIAALAVAVERTIAEAQKSQTTRALNSSFRDTAPGCTP